MGQPLGDDPEDLGRKTKTHVSRANLDMLHIRPVMVDAGFPRDERIGARVDGGHRRLKQDFVAGFDLSRHCVKIDPAAVKRARGDRVFGTADNGRSESDDLMDGLGALARRFARQITAEAPTDDPDRLLRFARHREDSPQYPWQQLRYIARTTPEVPAAYPVAEKP